MDHFSAVQSLCRIGLEEGGLRFRKQVERLRDRLSKAGDTKDATAWRTCLPAQLERERWRRAL